MSTPEQVSASARALLAAGNIPDREAMVRRAKAVAGADVHAEKAAPPPGDSPLEFVMSDDSVDRMGDVIEASGWDLSNFKADRNPVALFNHRAEWVIGNWTDVRIKGNRLIGKLRLAEFGTSEIVNTVRSLIKQGVLRAVSVGFKPRVYEALDGEDIWNGIRFQEQELLECSVVAVPANPNALAVAKSMNLPRGVISEIFSMSANEDSGRSLALTRMSAKSLVPHGAKMTRSEKIQAAQQAINEMTTRLNALDDLETRSDSDEAEYQALPDRITETRGALEHHLKIERAVAGQAASTALTVKTGQTLPTTNRISIPAQPKSVENPRELLYKTAAAMFVAKGANRLLEDVLRDPMRYGTDEIAGAVIRTISNPAVTTNLPWAGHLVPQAVADFINQLPRASIYPTLKRLGVSFTFGVNGSIKFPSRVVATAADKINGSFVGEGSPIPVRSGQITSVTLTAKKMAVISTFSREMAQHSQPSIESVIRQAMNEDTAETIDSTLIDNVVADAIRPAGLLYGLTTLTPAATGTQFEKMVADINTLAGVITGNRGGTSLVMIMPLAQQRKMAWAVAPNGTFVFQSVENGVVRDLNVVASPTVPANRVIMLDAAEFATATGDSPEFDVSDVATIHEETVPLPIVGGVVQPPVIGSIAAPVRSLWQTASLGVRMILPMNWAMRRTGMVAFMDGVTW